MSGAIGGFISQTQIEQINRAKAPVNTPNNLQKPETIQSPAVIEQQDSKQIEGLKTGSASTSISFLQDTSLPKDTSPSFGDIAAKKGRLKLGQSGESVSVLQRTLKEMGFHIKETGSFDAQTEKAVKEFQRANGIRPTGQFGNISLEALRDDGNDDTELDKLTQRAPTREAISTELVSAEAPSAAGQALAGKAEKIAHEMAKHRNPKHGKCYRGVKAALSQSLGVNLQGGHAYEAANQLARSDKFEERKIPASELGNLPAGAVVVWGKTNKSKDGHISIALGNGKEASDHVSNQLQALRGFSNFRVFIPK